MPGTRCGDGWGEPLWRIGLVLTIGATVGAALAVGGAHTYVLLTLAPACLIGCACLLCSRQTDGLAAGWPRAVWVLVGLAIYSWLQAMPLPLSLLKYLSPTAAGIWRNALSPFGEKVAWGALSLEPGASLRESLKWFTYAANLVAAIAVVRRYGRRVPAMVVVGSALVAALATIAHGLMGATKVFGVYEPALSSPHWAVGPFLNPNTLSGYLNLGAFVGLGLLFSRRFADQKWIVASVVATLMGVSLLSGSRGGAIGLTFGLMLYALLSARARRHHGERALSSFRTNWPRFAPALAALVAALTVLLLGASQVTWRQLAQADLEKLKIVAWAVPMIEDFWLFGAGRGAFAAVFPAYAPSLGNNVYTYPENMIVQWASEWGVPVTIAALCALVRWFRPRAINLRADTLSVGSATGVSVLLVQNLVDFGLERMATPLAVTWALAILLGRAKPSASRGASARSGGRGTSILFVVALGVWIAAVAVARDDGLSRQRALHETAVALIPGDRRGVETLRTRLRGAMLSSPAEPYFARLGGEVSLLAGNSDVLKWTGRALERGMNDFRSHLLAARALRRYGALNQALLELRLTAELDPLAVSTAGTLAADWSSSVEELQRAAPKGETGARLLVVAAARLARQKKRHLYEPALRAALERDNLYIPAHQLLVEHLARKLKQGSCKTDEACVNDAFTRVDAFIEVDREHALGVELKARMLETLERVDAADRLLARACPRFREVEYTRCLRQRLLILATLADPPLAKVIAVSEELAELPCGTPPACARLFGQVGTALLRSGAPEQALKFLRRSVRHHGDLPTLFTMAEIAVDLGQFRQAEAFMERAEIVAGPGKSALVNSRREAVRRRMLKRFRK